MLDPLPLGEKYEEELRELKCEFCGILFVEGEDSDEDLDSIDETGYCLDCEDGLSRKFPGII